jgi:hypothetical protein
MSFWDEAMELPNTREMFNFGNIAGVFENRITRRGGRYTVEAKSSCRVYGGNKSLTVVCSCFHRSDKRNYAVKVYDMVRALTPSGRFIQYEKKSEEWVVADREKVLEKICQALREKKWLDYKNSPANPCVGYKAPTPLKPKDKSPASHKGKSARPAKNAEIKQPATSNKTGSSPAAVTVSTSNSASTPPNGIGSGAVASKNKTPLHALMLPSPTASGSHIPGGVVTSAETKKATSSTTKSHENKSEKTKGSKKRRPLPLSRNHQNSSANSHPKPVILEVGTRISVLWPLDNAYYDATVQRCSVNHHFLEYEEDGETEWLDLSKHKFKIVS